MSTNEIFLAIFSFKNAFYKFVAEREVNFSSALASLHYLLEQLQIYELSRRLGLGIC